MNRRRVTGANGESLLLPGTTHDPLPRQIVSLAFLDDQIPADRIGEQLAASLCAETGASVIHVRLQHQEEPASLPGALPKLYLNGEFHLPPAWSRTEAGFYSLTVGIRSEPPTPPGIASLIQQLSRHFRYVLISMPANEGSTPWVCDFFARSHLAYLFLGPSVEAVRRLGLIMRQAGSQALTAGTHVKIIGCPAAGAPGNEFDRIAEQTGTPIHLFIRHCHIGHSPHKPAIFDADIRRLAREIGGRLLGLALSSGAAKGFAHVGVIQVLEEHGIEVDVVAGASMGAYVGALWAHGCDGAELERLSRELETRWALWTLIDPAFPPRRGFLRGFAVKRRLMRSVGHERFADLVRPLRVVASNLATLERVVFAGGEVATAVHASIAVPGICVPVVIDGETYSDGGIVDPLPVDVLHEMGVSRVIAVNVIPTPDRIRCAIEAELEQRARNGLRNHGLLRQLVRIHRQVNYFARGNLLEILMRSVHGAQIRMAEVACEMADVVLRPRIYDDRWLDYRNPGKFIALGREAAEGQLAEIQALVDRKEVLDEPKPARETVATIA